MKNVLTGKTVDRTLNAGVKVETATVDRRDMQYLYNDRLRLYLHGSVRLRADPRVSRDHR